MTTNLTLSNGAKVLRATLRYDIPGTVPHGVALCEWHNDYVVWNVFAEPSNGKWDAEQGDYFPKGKMGTTMDGADLAFDAATSMYETRARHAR